MVKSPAENPVIKSASFCRSPLTLLLAPPIDQDKGSSKSALGGFSSVRYIKRRTHNLLVMRPEDLLSLQ